jgi:hypothetical protein
MEYGSKDPRIGIFDAAALAWTVMHPDIKT